MNLKYITLDTELEFRKYVVERRKKISQVYIFESKLDNTIYFYCFFKDGLIVMTSEFNEKDISSFIMIYSEITVRYEFHIIKDNTFKTLKYIKK